MMKHIIIYIIIYAYGGGGVRGVGVGLHAKESIARLYGKDNGIWPGLTSN